MRIFDIIAMCWRNLFRRKVRTLLTVTGVVIGTCSIVVMISFGVGIDQYYAQSLRQLGDLTLGEVSTWGGGGGNGQPEDITDEIVAQMAAIPHVSAISPFYDMWNEGVIVAGSNDRYLYQGNVRGVYLDQMEAFGFEFTEGGWPTEEEKENAIVFGEHGAYQFMDTKKRRNNMVWPEEQPDGTVKKPFVDVNTARIRVSGRQDGSSSSKGKKVRFYDLRSTGVLVENYNIDYGSDYGVYIDMSLVKKLAADTKRLNGTSSSDGQKKDIVYNEIRIKVDDMDNVSEVITAIEAMGYQTSSMGNIRDQLQEQTRVIQMVLGALGGVSLLVAAIGITNTMVMSIYERTREIGVMKVLGCVVGNIRTLFLMEAASIGLLGGVLGIGISYGLSYALNHLVAGSNALGGMLGFGMMDGMQVNISVIPPWLVLLALVFSTCVGILSGFYPANRAVKISALEAIKHE